MISDNEDKLQLWRMFNVGDAVPKELESSWVQAQNLANTHFLNLTNLTTAANTATPPATAATATAATANFNSARAREIVKAHYHTGGDVGTNMITILVEMMDLALNQKAEKQKKVSLIHTHAEMSVPHTGGGGGPAIAEVPVTEITAAQTAQQAELLPPAVVLPQTALQQADQTHDDDDDDDDDNDNDGSDASLSLSAATTQQADQMSVPQRGGGGVANCLQAEEEEEPRCRRAQSISAGGNIVCGATTGRLADSQFSVKRLISPEEYGLENEPIFGTLYGGADGGVFRGVGTGSRATFGPIVVKKLLLSDIGLVVPELGEEGEEGKGEFVQNKNEILYLPQNPVTEILIHQKISGCDHIVKTKEHTYDDTHLYKVTEQMDYDLFEYIALRNQKGHLTVPESRDLFTQLIVGVSFLQKNNICHLDLSPGNILLQEIGHTGKHRLKISDFAHAHCGQQVVYPSEQTYRFGKLYIPPEFEVYHEQFDGFRADLYNCGAILLYMLTGTLMPPACMPPCLGPWFLGFNAFELVENLLCGAEDRWDIKAVLDCNWMNPSESIPHLATRFGAGDVYNLGARIDDGRYDHQDGGAYHIFEGKCDSYGEIAVRTLSLAKFHDGDCMKYMMDDIKIREKIIGNHPNILKIYESVADEKDNCMYQAIEYMDCNLHEYLVQKEDLRKGTCLSDAEARHYFKQLLAGVEFLHNNKICHLDISVYSLMVRGQNLNATVENLDGKLKISNFCLAQEHKSECGVKYTAEHLDDQLGSGVEYRVPEGNDGDYFDGFKADMFCCGAVLFRMLFGFFYQPDADGLGSFSTRYLLNHKKKLLKKADDGAFELLKNLLCPEEKRWDLKTVFGCAWMKNGSSPTQK